MNGEKILHESLVNALGLRDYDFIMKHAYKTNVEHDSDFQKRFNAFYRVRKDEAWRKEYYSVFESAKKIRILHLSSFLMNCSIEQGMLKDLHQGMLLAQDNGNGW